MSTPFRFLNRDEFDALSTTQEKIQYLQLAYEEMARILDDQSQRTESVDLLVAKPRH